MNDPAYSAREELHKGARTIVLRDHVRDQSARILMYLGNNLMELNANGREYMYFPESPAEFGNSMNLGGNPFLFPWANRLRGDFFHFAGKRYDLPPSRRDHIFRDGNGLPLHGLVLKSEAWEPTALDVTEDGALYTARLDWEKVPDGPENFPFPHFVETTHHLREGALCVRTSVHNTGPSPMPACFGHHPYFALPRQSNARLKIPAEDYLLLNDLLLPPGDTRKAAELMGDPENFFPARKPLDHVFTTLRREGDGRAWFQLETEERRLRVGFDANYPIAVIYAPAGQPFVCIEPMTAPTDAMNLHHDGAWPRLPVIAPGEVFTADFILDMPESSRDG